MSFPDGFLWGTATSAHQVEGGNVYNDSWLVEHVPCSPYAEARAMPATTTTATGRHRARAGLGLGAYRFSLEWSRIEPEEGEFSSAALDHYRRVLDLPRARPDADAHVPPLHLAALDRERRGLGDARTADRFARFCERAMRHLGDLVPYACTLNEPNLGRLLHDVLGIPSAPPATQDRIVPVPARASPRAAEVMRSAHRQALDAIKGVRAETSVGLTVVMTAWEAEPGGEETMARLRGTTEDEFLEDLEGDFIGVQTYTACASGPAGPIDPGPDAERTQMGYLFQPEALGHTIRRAAEMTGLPIFVTENGLGSDDDARRASSSRARYGASRSASPTASTCAATSTGRCSTTSSGPSATARRSVSWPSIA